MCESMWKRYKRYKPLRVITFKVDEKLLEKIDIFCKKHNMFRSELIRLAIKKYLSERT